jgi:FkbH-like protein
MTTEPSLPRRRITPFEWLYSSIESGFPPFAIQFKVETSVLPEPQELEHAVAKAAALNPGARLVANGRWWDHSSNPPKVRVIPSVEPYSLSCECVHSPLERNPPIEVLHWHGVGLIFRAAHALMDAGGLVFFAQDTFRALRGECLLGSNSNSGDWQHLKGLRHPTPRQTIWPDRQSPLGKPVAGVSGFTWKQRFVPGRVDSAAARIATAVGNLHPEPGLPCRIMMPVDLRLWNRTLRSTANFSSPLFLQPLPGGKWSDCYREILAALDRHDERAISRLDIVMSMVPRAALARLFLVLHDWQVRNNRYFCSALTSNVGPVRLRDFRLGTAEPRSISFLPFNSPGMGLSLLTIQHTHGLEIAASSPAATGADGRLDEALDQICLELTRGRTREIPESRFEGPKTAAIAIAASFVAEPVRKPLDFWLRKIGLQFDLRFAPYGQIFQNLVDPHSVFENNRDGINVILFRLEDWERDAREQVGAADYTHRLRDNIEEFLTTVETASTRTGISLIVWVGPLSTGPQTQAPFGSALQDLQAGLLSRLRSMTGVSLISPEDHERYYPIQAATNAHADQIGRVPYTQLMYTAVATLIARRVVELQVPPFKVLLLDCDDTLWEGVCAEAGPAGIKITPAHHALHTFLIDRVNAGMLLCLCSKNDPPDVQAVFETRRDMKLRPEHIVASRIDWHAKSVNVKSLAIELQVSLDSILFIDNNPLECAEVEANCPGVQVVQLPVDSTTIPAFLRHLWISDQIAPTHEASQRATTYHQNRQRNILRSTAPDYASFLDSLALQVEISCLRPDQIARAAELTRRTNQFNLRPSPSQAAHFRALDPSLTCLAVDVNDRFGAYGMTGLVVYEVSDTQIRIDTFLLSCRVLGRGVEHRVLATLGETALKAGCSEIVFPYVPTQKNQPVFTFLSSVCGPPHTPPYATLLCFSITAEKARRIRLDERQSCAATAPTAVDVESLPASRLLRSGLLNEIAHEYFDVKHVMHASGNVDSQNYPASFGSTGEAMLDALRDIVMTVTDLRVESLSPDLSLTDAGLDSINMVMLLTEAAQKFAPGVSNEMFYSALEDFFSHSTLNNLMRNITRMARA